MYMYMYICICINLYLYNTILLFHHISVLHNYTKTHTLTFYLALVLKVLNAQILLCFFFNSIANKLSVKNFVE